MNDTYNRRIPGNINDAIPMLQIGPKKRKIKDKMNNWYNIYISIVESYNGIVL